jgi:hypothetical protein
MPSSGQVSLREIEDMLEDCAPGAVIVPKPHHNWVVWKSFTYRGLPRGKHGARRNPEIEVGHVKRMARFFEILDCAKRNIPALV